MTEISPLWIVDIRNEYRHIDAFRTLKDFVIFITQNSRPSGKLQRRFTFSSSREYIKLFEMMECFRNCTIVWDEADALFSDRQFEKPMKNVFLGSRNNNITMYYACKRPFLIPILVRSQADTFVIFTTEEKRDVDYITSRTRKMFPKDPFKLSVGECIIFSQDKSSAEIQYIPKFEPEQSGIKALNI